MNVTVIFCPMIFFRYFNGCLLVSLLPAFNHMFVPCKYVIRLVCRDYHCMTQIPKNHVLWMDFRNIHTYMIHTYIHTCNTGTTLTCSWFHRHSELSCCVALFSTRCWFTRSVLSPLPFCAEFCSALGRYLTVLSSYVPARRSPRPTSPAPHRATLHRFAH